MSAESMATAVAMERTTAIELYTPRHREQQLGRTALEGFRLMEAAPNTWGDIKELLESRIVDQPAAIEAIIDALESSNVRMPNDKRPIANLAFLGPTGVGKSETGKSLAEFLGDGDVNLLKIDCSDFSHGHEVASLIGAPAGYVGYGQEPILSKEKVEGTGTVVLFDEIEKGSEPLYNLMLQIMEDGELQLKNGEVSSFRNTIIIMTSNLGAKEMAERLNGTPLGFAGNERPGTNSQQIDDVAKKKFKEHFRPEFINRLTDMIVFHPLDQAGLGRVLDTKLSLVNEEYEKQLGARLSLSEATREYLVDIAAKEMHMGARPLVRALEKHVQTMFGRYYGAGEIDEGTHVKVFRRSEVGLDDSAEDSPLVFASKPDKTIRRQVAPIALMSSYTSETHVTSNGEVEPCDDEEDYDDPEN